MNDKLVKAARILMGLIFLVFGSNGLLMIITGGGFIPMPAPSPEMGAVMGGFFGAGYLMPLVKIIEVAGGALLLFGAYKRLALTLLTPIVVNIVGLHLFLDPAGLPMGLALAVFSVILIRSEWDGFSHLLAK